MWANALVLFFLTMECTARIHKLTLKNETRFLVQLNTFGFYANGTLDVNMTALSFTEPQGDNTVGFSLSRSRVSGVLSYTAEEQATCPLDANTSNNDEPLILFVLDFRNQRVMVRSLGKQDNVLTARAADAEKRSKRQADQKGNGQAAAAGDGKPNVDKPPADNKAQGKPEDVKPGAQEQANQDAEQKPEPEVKPQNPEEGMTSVELSKMKENENFYLALGKKDNSYNFSFHLTIGTLAQGLYNLNFHKCVKMGQPYSLSVEVTEKNPEGFLSAAEIPLSRLYIGMAGVFFTAALVWVYTLMKHRYSVFKIHWLMAALAFTKATSLVFHSINYHFINTEGHPIEGWAVMYYITHLLKGALLFITLALIGTGWAFVKYILSDKEKKIFMIVIPLQVLANVAYIIIESTEEGTSEYSLWKQVLFLVDLIAAGHPVPRRLVHPPPAEASSTDGKAAVNLEKLKLFRHYYVMIRLTHTAVVSTDVCYIYFTRIIAILLKITMPFQWQWCYEFLVEVSTLIFFVLTGYNFRPASNNPYLQLPQDEDDVEMDEVVTESGALEGISKVKKTSNGRDRQKESTL
ncbi:hypothetical protein WMY93_005790 [Mugilogobius chulae]|uniref:GOST seven transmembrane domain-containing protein n=1 Tax=Mugilogobius chulae TaxID=88201 RepID=A0AAW0PIV6_9GOBI